LLAEGFLRRVVPRLFGLGFGFVLGLDDLVVEPGLVEVEAGVAEVEAGVSNGHAVVVELAFVVELGGSVLGRVLEAAFAELEFGGPVRFAGLAGFDAFLELFAFVFERFLGVFAAKFAVFFVVFELLGLLLEAGLVERAAGFAVFELENGAGGEELHAGADFGATAGENCAEGFEGLGAAVGRHGPVFADGLDGEAEVLGLFVVERVGGCGSGCRWVEISGDGDHGNLDVQFALTHGNRGLGIAWQALISGLTIHTIETRGEFDRPKWGSGRFLWM
jgi:hypothetical protein